MFDHFGLKQADARVEIFLSKAQRANEHSKEQNVRKPGISFGCTTDEVQGIEQVP